MATWIVEHGAWHGGWCYRETVAALPARQDAMVILPPGLADPLEGLPDD